MTGKQRLECVLNGQVPDVPPHWELVFQIEKEMFGMDPAAVSSCNMRSRLAILGAFMITQVFLLASKQAERTRRHRQTSPRWAPG